MLVAQPDGVGGVRVKLRDRLIDKQMCSPKLILLDELLLLLVPLLLHVPVLDRSSIVPSIYLNERNLHGDSDCSDQDPELPHRVCPSVCLVQHLIAWTLTCPCAYSIGSSSTSHLVE